MKTDPNDPVVSDNPREPNGLTKRELAAMLICQGMNSDPEDMSEEREEDETCEECCARRAVAQADALLKELAK